MQVNRTINFICDMLLISLLHLRAHPFQSQLGQPRSPRIAHQIQSPSVATRIMDSCSPHVALELALERSGGSAVHDASVVPDDWRVSFDLTLTPIPLFSASHLTLPSTKPTQLVTLNLFPLLNANPFLSSRALSILNPGPVTARPVA